MKLIVSVFLLFGFQTFAAELRLNPGDSVLIEPGQQTRVTCGTGNGAASCTESVNGFRKLVETCSQTFSPGSCAKKHWPRFKAENPGCSYAGLETCLQACTQTFSPGECANNICN